MGLAVADELGLLAHPRPYLDGKNRVRVIASLCRLAREEGIGLFLVGLPINMDGSEGPSARRARKFATELEKKSRTRVELVDERLSTVEAQSLLHEQGLDARRSRQRIDSASAAVLLQGWLDGQRGWA